MNPWGACIKELYDGLISAEIQADFEKALADAGSKLVMVDFYADWCGPCKMIAPKVKVSCGYCDVHSVLKLDLYQGCRAGVRFSACTLHRLHTKS